MASAPTAHRKPPARLRVNVLPLFQGARAHKLGDAFVLDVDATASILELKQEIRSLLQKTEAVFVPSVFRLRQPLEGLDSTTISGNTTDPAISDVVVRRENYLHSTATVGSYWEGAPTTNAASDATAAKADLCVIALAISPYRDLHGTYSWSQVFDTDVAPIETLLLSNISTDGTLPPSPSRAGTRIFVRDVYVCLHEHISAWFKLLDDGQATKEPPHKRCKTITADYFDRPQYEHGDTVVVTATPGTGKTALLWFLVHQLSATHDVVVQCLDLFLLVRPDGTMIRGTESRSFEEELDRRETIYLVDVEDDVSHLCMVPWRAKMVVVTAPNPKLVASIRGQRSRMETLFMPMWTLAELEQCRRTCYADRSMEDDYVATLFAHYGGVARSIFLLNHPVEKKICGLQSAINWLKEDDVHVILRLVEMQSEWHKAPYNVNYPELLHVKSTSSDLASATLEVASPFVHRAVIQRRKELAKIKKKYQNKNTIAAAKRKTRAAIK